MMKKKHVLFVLLVIAALIPLSGRAQQDSGYFPLQKGRSITFTHYDGKDKITGYTQQTVTEVSKTAEGLKAVFMSEHKDAKGNTDVSGEVYMRSKGNTYYFDIRNILDINTLKMFQDREIEVTGNDLELPVALSVGQTLPDASMTVKMSMEGFPMPSMTIRVFDRQVVGLEEVTTPAGTYSCYKIDYQTEIECVFTSRLKASEWVTKNVGMVKSETYNKKGKLIGKMLLSQFD